MQEKKTNVKAVLSLVLSCLSIVCCCVWYVGMLLGLAAIILGIVSLRDSRFEKSDMAVAGIVVGSVGFALGAVVAIVNIVASMGLMGA